VTKTHGSTGSFAVVGLVIILAAVGLVALGGAALRVAAARGSHNFSAACAEQLRPKFIEYHTEREDVRGTLSLIPLEVRCEYFVYAAEDGAPVTIRRDLGSVQADIGVGASLLAVGTLIVIRVRRVKSARS
jgi:hypothetical protein